MIRVSVQGHLIDLLPPRVSWPATGGRSPRDCRYCMVFGERSIFATPNLCLYYSGPHPSPGGCRLGQVLRTIIWPARFGKSQNSEILKRRFNCDHSPTGRVIRSNSSVDELPGGTFARQGNRRHTLRFGGWSARVASADTKVVQAHREQLD